MENCKNPFSLVKVTEHKKIILVKNDESIRDDKKNADIIYFVNVTKILDVPEITTEQISMNIDIVDVDPIDTILHKFYNHPSVLKIRENVKLTETFTFSKINETQIIKEILELYPRNSAGFDAIPSKKIIKNSVTVLSLPLTNLFNTSVVESLFPSDLQNANVTPPYKKDDSTNKENYRPISILPSISKIFEKLMFQQISSYIYRVHFRLIYVAFVKVTVHSMPS